MQGRNPFFSARNALVIATMSVALAGCLSKEESESETSFVGELSLIHI